jgi:HK97 family phage major capsid protein
MENKELLEQVSKTIENSLPEVVDAVVEKKFAQENEKTVAQLKEVQDALKSLSFQAKSTDVVAQKSYKEAFIVSVMKDVAQNNVNTEKGFNAVVEKTYAAMNTNTEGAGAEFVFDQFEADILAVFDTFAIVNDVRVYNINKGDNLTLVRGDNTIQTYFTAQGAARTPSNYTTSDIKVDVAKLTTMTKLTEEFFDDTMTIPDVYAFLVRCFGESQAKFLETEILTGTGDIEGIFTNEAVLEVTVDDVDSIDDTTIVETITKAAKKFTGNEKFYYSKYMWGKLMALKTLDGYPLYPELRNAVPTLMGVPVALSSVGFIQAGQGTT